MLGPGEVVHVCKIDFRAMGRQRSIQSFWYLVTIEGGWIGVCLSKDDDEGVFHETDLRGFVIEG